MREIEIKAKVEDTNKLLEQISREGIILPEGISQIDLIFVIKPYKLSEIKKGSSPILRIRKEKNRFTLNLKRDITDQLDSIEYETEIKDVESMVSILNELGYHQVIEVRKLRKKLHIAGFSTCLDEVEGLGVFIELESTIEDDDGNIDDIRSKMWGVLNNLNISTENEVTKGYDRLLDELQ